MAKNSERRICDIDGVRLFNTSVLLDSQVEDEKMSEEDQDIEGVNQEDNELLEFVHEIYDRENMRLSMLEDWKQYLNVQIFEEQLKSLTAHQHVQRTLTKVITALLAPFPRLGRLQ